MKILLFAAFFICTVLNGLSQSDTIYLQNNQKVFCKILEVNELEIKYNIAESAGDSVFVIKKGEVIKFVLFNGYSDAPKLNQLLLENEHKKIIDRRMAIKINPYSPAFNHISMAFEKVFKTGMNLDIQLGYVNSTINYSDYSSLNMNHRAYHVGGYIKPGIKLLLGQDFSVKELKYAHPLKGRYIRFELPLSYINFQDVHGYLFDPKTFQSTGASTIITTNINSISYGAFVNFGRQFILANTITIEYFFGAGFTTQHEEYINSAYRIAYDGGNGYGFSTDSHENTNYYGFVRLPRIGELGGVKLALSGTLGLRVGYIIPSKKRTAKKAEDPAKTF